eukprot:3216424-Pyramimonas_sp.AAC.1
MPSIAWTMFLLDLQILDWKIGRPKAKATTPMELKERLRLPVREVPMENIFANPEMFERMAG